VTEVKGSLEARPNDRLRLSPTFDSQNRKSEISLKRSTVVSELTDFVRCEPPYVRRETPKRK